MVLLREQLFSSRWGKKMDKRFIAHTDYIDNRANTTNAILRCVLEQALPRRLDTMEKIDEIPRDFRCYDNDCIPLGDLNWVRAWLSHVPDAKDPLLTPIEVPDAMARHLHREYFRCLGKDIPPTCLDGSRYFLKDADTLKKWNSLLYDGKLSGFIESDTLYTVSEKVNFLSEWRVFVYQDIEQGAFNYLGDPMMFPDTEAIHDMVSSWKTAGEPHPRAYTLDVGIISDPRTKRHSTVPIEVHPFVACGLYGFSDPVIADMLVAGYEWYRDDAPKRRMN